MVSSPFDIGRQKWCAVAIIVWSLTVFTQTKAWVRSDIGGASWSRLGNYCQRTDKPFVRSSSCLVKLSMGKNMSRSRNKQADLLKKMQQAKQQKQGDQDGTKDDSKGEYQQSDDEIKERNDRLRFEELLRKESASAMNAYSSDGYLTRQQEEEELNASFNAARSNVDRIFEGDPAPTECFEELVSIKSENAIGKGGAERLVPWLRKNPARQNDYRIIVSDPRLKSPEFREMVKRLLRLPVDIRSRLTFVTADSPAEIRRWLKKDSLEEKIDIYADEKREWMRAYTALGEQRWSITMFVISQQRVQKIAREMDMYDASRTVRNAVKSLNEPSL